MTEPAPDTPTPRQHQIVLWVLWFAFLNGIVMFRIFLAKPLPPGAAPQPDAFPWAISLLPVLLSVAVRWALLPRAQFVQQGLVYMVLGLAFAEASSFLGIFLTPSHLDLICGASFLGAFQFAPLWARRFFPAEDAAPAPPLVPRR